MNYLKISVVDEYYGFGAMKAHTEYVNPVCIQTVENAQDNLSKISTSGRSVLLVDERPENLMERIRDMSREILGKDAKCILSK